MRIAKLALPLLLAVLVLPVALASAWVGYAQSPSAAITVPAESTVNAAQVALEPTNAISMDREAEHRLICHCEAFAYRFCAVAMSDELSRAWRSYYVILPKMVAADSAVERSSSHPAKSTPHLML